MLKNSPEDNNKPSMLPPP